MSILYIYTPEKGYTVRDWQKAILPSNPEFPEEIQPILKGVLKGRVQQVRALKELSENPDSPHVEDAKRAVLYANMVELVKGIHVKGIQEALEAVVNAHGTPAAKAARSWLSESAKQSTDMQLRLAAHAALSFLEFHRQWTLRSAG